MKFHCNLEIHDRMLCVCSQRRSQSILAFAKKSIEDDDVYLYLQTRQNKQGTKYQIANNIVQVFTKFIADGKITIRLAQPSHDLIIKSDTVQLKNFLRILSYITNGHSQYIKQYTLMPNVFFNSNQFSLGKVKVVVKNKSEYPTLHGFAKTTEQLILSGLNRKSFDRQILRLQSLRVLDLSDNKLSYLPKELGTLPHLQQLLLSQNNLGKSTKSKWAWLEQTAIKHNLHLLDISSNSLTELPVQIRNLNALVNLKIGQNALTHLPHNIGALQNLRVLDVAKNRLSYLPVTIMYLRLEFLDVTGNPFAYATENYVHGNDNTTSVRVLSLVEWSAKSILKSRYLLKSRITYDASIIPYTLVDYLDEAKCCHLCKTACFDCYIRKLIYLPLPCNEIKTSHPYTAFKFECYFCSLVCVSNYPL